MAILKIITQGNPILKKKAKAIKIISSAHKKLIQNMIDTMLAAPGVGLAAPQVGISERIIVVGYEEKIIPLINPRIKAKKGKQICKEGCLSVPGLEAEVERSEEIIVTGLDKNGKQVIFEVKGFPAVIFQHEIDHLEGILFLEKVKDLSTIKIIDKHKKEDK